LCTVAANVPGDVNECDYQGRWCPAGDIFMPYYFEFDPKNRILRCRFDGAIADQTLREFFGVAREYVAKTRPLAGIADLLAVTSFEATPETIRELASSPPVLPQTR
jgi:hypothetical protein